MNQSRWRRQAAPIIARVLRETAGRPDAEVRRALRDAYPFGVRRYHPYKIWLDEIRRQTGTKKGQDEFSARVREIEEHNARVSGEESVLTG